jgi:hypothetical protein
VFQSARDVAVLIFLAAFVRFVQMGSNAVLLSTHVPNTHFCSLSTNADRFNNKEQKQTKSPPLEKSE